MFTPVNPSFTIQKWSVWGSTLHGHVSLMLTAVKIRCILHRRVIEMIPNFISDEPVVYITKETHTTDAFVTSIYAADSDLDIDNDYIRWNITDDTKLIPWDYPNVTRTDRLFYIDGCKCFIFFSF